MALINFGVSNFTKPLVIFSKKEQPVESEEVENAHFTPQATFVCINVAPGDKTALVWKLNRTQDSWARQLTRLTRYSYFVSGVSASRDASHLLTSSWDGIFHLWGNGALSTKRVFLSLNKDRK